MKTTVNVKKEVDLKTLEVHANVRYFEDATVNGIVDVDGNLMPCIENGSWRPIIDIDLGIITNWIKGNRAYVHYKVCDAGSYFLKDEQGNTILSIEEDYVPEIMCPEGSGYGDYIKMKIDENGQIENWKPSLAGFVDEDED